MADTRRVFTVPEPAFTEDDILRIPSVHDGSNLELFYNLVLQNDGLKLPEHLRPPVWAIGDTTIDKVMIIISPGAGKSQLVDVVLPVWELGLDVTQTVLGVSSAEGLMTTFIQASMNILEHNTVYHQLFPRTLPDKNTRWSAFGGIYVQRGQSGLAPPSFSVAGTSSKQIIGKHARVIVCDDIHDEDNSSSSEQIDKVEDWYYRTLLGRQDPQGSRLIMIGRRWAEDDLYGRLLKAGDWLVMTLPSIREGKELFYDVSIPAYTSCVFNNYTSSTKVEEIKVVYGEDTHSWKPPGSPKEAFYWPRQIAKYKEAVEVRKNKPSMFEIVYQSRPEKAGIKIFNKEDFRYYSAPSDLDYGLNSADVSNFISQFDFLIQSWDTAFNASGPGDPSCCYTVGLKQCNEFHSFVAAGVDKPDVPYHYDIYVLDEYNGQLSFGDITAAAVEAYNKWAPSWVLVEKSANGIPLIQELTKYSVPIEPAVVQGTTKRGRAVNGAKAGSAQGWFKQHRVYFPSNVFWVNALETELKEFTGLGKRERDDRVDALIQVINYSIDLGIKLRELPDGWRDPKQLEIRLAGWHTPANHFMQLEKMTKSAFNPFYGTCSTCKSFKDNFCSVHKQAVTPLHSCPYFSPAVSQEQFIQVVKQDE